MGLRARYPILLSIKLIAIVCRFLIHIILFADLIPRCITVYLALQHVILVAFKCEHTTGLPHIASPIGYPIKLPTWRIAIKKALVIRNTAVKVLPHCRRVEMTAESTI